MRPKGKLYPPGSSDEIAHSARLGFLAALMRTTLEVIEDLSANGEPAKWARKFHLNAVWMRQTAARTLVEWRKLGTRDPKVMLWAFLIYSRLKSLPTETALTVSTVQWDPRRESEAEFRTRVLRLVKKELHDHIGQTRRRLLNRSWKEAPEIRSRLHYDWLVYRQVYGWSYERIAAHFRRTRRTTEEAVKELAALIGLPVRAVAKGRPRGARDRRPRNRPV